MVQRKKKKLNNKEVVQYIKENGLAPYQSKGIMLEREYKVPIVDKHWQNKFENFTKISMILFIKKVIEKLILLLLLCSIGFNISYSRKTYHFNNGDYQDEVEITFDLANEK